MSTYGQNPHWITAHFRGRCRRCGATIIVGSRAYYYPQSRQLLCTACGNDVIKPAVTPPAAYRHTEAQR